MPEENIEDASADVITSSPPTEFTPAAITPAEADEKLEIPDAPVIPDETADDPPVAEAQEEEEHTDSEPLDLEKVDSDTSFRLRTGEVMTLGEMKKSLGKLEELERSQDDFRSEQRNFFDHQRQFKTWSDQRSQEYQNFELISKQAEEALKMQLPEIPEAPDVSLMESEPLLFQQLDYQRRQAMEQHNAITGQMQQNEQNRRVVAQQQHNDRQQKAQVYVEQQHEELLEKIPRLRDKGEMRTFVDDFMALGKDAGFSKNELNKVHDSRLMTIMNKAIAYDKLTKADKVKTVSKNTGNKPAKVAKAGRLVTSGEAGDTQKSKIFERARKRGSLSIGDAEALIMQLD